MASQDMVFQCEVLLFYLLFFALCSSPRPKITLVNETTHKIISLSLDLPLLWERIINRTYLREAGPPTLSSAMAANSLPLIAPASV
jgi:hypothetical protein